MRALKRTILRICSLYAETALTDDFKPMELGFSGIRRENIVNYMNSVYGENKIKELGAVAIKIRLLEG
jgi:hypothetical protein